MSILPKEPRQIKAIHVGHIEVDQDQVRPVYNGRSQPRLGVVSRADQCAKPFEHLLRDGESGEVLLHDQDHDSTKGPRGKGDWLWGHSRLWHCPLGIEPIPWCEDLGH